MKDEDFKVEFPWFLAFIVNGLCCFGFIGLMKLLNSSFPQIFLWIGTGSLSLGFFLGIVALFFKARKNTSLYSSGENRK